MLEPKGLRQHSPGSDRRSPPWVIYQQPCSLKGCDKALSSGARRRLFHPYRVARTLNPKTQGGDLRSNPGLCCFSPLGWLHYDSGRSLFGYALATVPLPIKAFKERSPTQARIRLPGPSIALVKKRKIAVPSPEKATHGARRWQRMKRPFRTQDPYAQITRDSRPGLV